MMVHRTNNTLDFHITALHAALMAGEKIMEVYSNSFNVDIKSDGSPITLADRMANEVITNALSQTNIPIISEEQPIPDWEVRKDWEAFWLVDPLDGTKEFVNRNGEFTVNIALIENNQPVFGILTAPAGGYGYMGWVGKGAYRMDNLDSKGINKVKSFSELIRNFTPLRPGIPQSTLFFASSRSHKNPENEKIRNILFPGINYDVVEKGSALKFGLTAQGTTHYYFRNDSIWEWDTAAGHAILNAAGGHLLCWPDASELSYNKKDLRNPAFVACCNKKSLELLKKKFPL